MALDRYRQKRDLRRTPEPRGAHTTGRGNSFVIHKHAARRLHYDLRLEHNGVLLSWAVPKGPSLDPGQRRLAVRVEDHPLDYGSFEGNIPKGEYGAGAVIVWDRGHWLPRGDAAAGLGKGHLRFRLEGKKLAGEWSLVRTGKAAEAGKGLHVVVPIARNVGWDEIKTFAKAVAQAMAADEPAKYTAVMAKAKRHGKIFIDYLRNGWAATAVAAFSTRALSGAPVSAPLFWQELDSCRADSFTIANIRTRLEQLKSDPWADYEAARCALTSTMRKKIAA